MKSQELTRAKAEKIVAQTSDPNLLRNLTGHKNPHVRYKANRKLGITNLTPRQTRNLLRTINWLLRLPERVDSLESLITKSADARDAFLKFSSERERALERLDELPKDELPELTDEEKVLMKQKAVLEFDIQRTTAEIIATKKLITSI